MTTIDASNIATAVAFELEVTLSGPLCLSVGVPTGNITYTRDYIPGPSVRGMLAQYYLDTSGGADDVFRQLFVSGKISFGNMYLCPHGATAKPLPLSARSCKYAPGFRADENAHGVIDILLDSFMWEKCNTPASIPPNQCSHLETSHNQPCNAPLEPFGGLYAYINDTPLSVPASDYHQLITRSATDNRLQTAEQGLLYTLEILDPTPIDGNLVARGWTICATPDDAALFRKHIVGPAFEDTTTTFYIGTARSRGLGALETFATPVTSVDLQTQTRFITERMDCFNSVLKTIGIADDRYYFSLTLLSDTIIQDEYFRFHNTIPASYLACEAGCDPSSLRLESVITETRTVGGWNAALCMPKAEMIAIRMGSVFLYSVQGIDPQFLADRLSRIESMGLGIRRGEGFGRVVVCDPFHTLARKDAL